MPDDHKGNASAPRPRDRSLQPLVVVPVLAALLLFPLIFTTSTWQNMMILVLLYAYWGQAWNILGGYVGQVSFCHAVFVGIGAYTSSLLLINYGLNPWLGMAMGALLAMLVAAIIGVPAFRLRGHFFLMATVGFGGAERPLRMSLWRWPRICRSSVSTRAEQPAALARWISREMKSRSFIT